MEEVIKEIYEWYLGTSEPNRFRRYSRCPICNTTWWDDVERHKLDCWVPRLVKETEPVKPCKHPGCRLHITHPCERCGRQWGTEPVKPEGECMKEPEQKGGA